MNKDKDTNGGFDFIKPKRLTNECCGGLDKSCPNIINGYVI